MLQALFYGPAYAKGIANWIEKITNAAIILQSKEVSYYLGVLKKEGRIRYYKKYIERGTTRGEKRKYFIITDTGRAALIQVRECLKMVFSEIPDELKDKYGLEES